MKLPRPDTQESFEMTQDILLATVIFFAVVTVVIAVCGTTSIGALIVAALMGL